MIREDLNPDGQIEGILPTMVDTRTLHAKEALELLEENFGDPVFGARIRKTVRFAEAPVRGMSVLKYDPTGKAAEAYRHLAKEVLSNGRDAASELACARGRSPSSSARRRNAAPERRGPGVPPREERAPAGVRRPRRRSACAHAFSADIPRRDRGPRDPPRSASRASRPPRGRARPALGGDPCCGSSASAAPASTPSTA